jgi:uncharacterized protein YjbI with pentapeptide repeats
MEKAKLDEILANHKKWLEENGGERANLRFADLNVADLSGADLKFANLSCADLSGADLSEADLRYADLSGADLRGADLSGANFDYSCFPLWCGGTDFKCDDKLILQLLAQISTLEYESNIITEEHRAMFLELGKHSHRASDLGLT